MKRANQKHRRTLRREGALERRKKDVLFWEQRFASFDKKAGEENEKQAAEAKSKLQRAKNDVKVLNERLGLGR